MRALLDRLSSRVIEEDRRPGLRRGTTIASAAFRPFPDLPESELPEQVRRAIRFLDAHYDSHITIDEVAEAACVSPAWLSASFKRFTGLSIMEYARLRRTQKACELLSGTDAPLKEIADKLSFPDLPTFAKLFRKVVGTSPGAYRKSLHGAGDEHRSGG
jgi:AraC-like DNA-binding protein